MFLRKKKAPYGTWRGEEIKDNEDGREALIDRVTSALEYVSKNLDEWTIRHALDACLVTLLFILKNAKFGK